MTLPATLRDLYAPSICIPSGPSGAVSGITWSSINESAPKLLPLPPSAFGLNFPDIESHACGL